VVLLVLSKNIKLLKNKILNEISLRKERYSIIWLLSFFKVEDFIPDTTIALNKTVFSLLILTIISLWCFLSIIGYLLGLYIVHYSKLEEKYPKLKILLDFYKKSNYILIIIEIVIFLGLHFALIGMYISLLYFNN
jgi:hypothetical protein